MIIDAHAHVLAPPEVYAFKATFLANRGGHGRLVPSISDAKLQEQIDIAVRLMDSVGTDIQFISPRPYQLMHSEQPGWIVHHWVKIYNDIIARVVNLRPDRFRGVCGLPQALGEDPKLWIPEMDRCINDLGFVGILLNPDPSEGRNSSPALGDPYWYPVYKRMVELDVPALVHSAACCAPRESYSSHFITEESIAILSVAKSRVFVDFPNLKLIIGHGGGSIPYQIGRWRAERHHPRMGKEFLPLQESFDETLRRFNFDTCLYSKESLELLFKICGPENCVFGTEKPGSGSAVDPGTGRDFDFIRPLIEEIPALTPEQRNMIFSENAMKLFSRFRPNA